MRLHCILRLFLPYFTHRCTTCRHVSYKNPAGVGFKMVCNCRVVSLSRAGISITASPLTNAALLRKKNPLAPRVQWGRIWTKTLEGIVLNFEIHWKLKVLLKSSLWFVSYRLVRQTNSLINSYKDCDCLVFCLSLFCFVCLLFFVVLPYFLSAVQLPRCFTTEQNTVTAFLFVL